MAKKQKTKTENKQNTESGTVEKSKVKMTRQEIVREKILEAQGQIEGGYLEMAQLLTEAYHGDFHETWGFETFEAYCDKELDIKYRKARYFIDIWDKVKSLDLPKDQVAALGWTKMKEISAVITEKNAKEWMRKAEKMSSRELAEAAKIVRKKDTKDSDVPSITTLTLRMTEAEANVILEAIEEAKSLCDSTNAVIALEMICQDWLTAKGVTPERTSLKDYIAYIEKLYGVKVSVKQETSKKKTEQQQETEDILDETNENGSSELEEDDDTPELPDLDDVEEEEADDGEDVVDIDDILGIAD